jgi:CTP-dependent riboflavin kinase
MSKNTETGKNIITHFFAVALLIWSILIFIGASVNFSEGKETIGSLIVPLFFMGILPFAGGIYLLVSRKRKNKLAQISEFEKIILTTAHSKQGYVTTLDLVLLTGCSTEEAQKKLTEMQEKGFFDLKITSKGDIIYALRGMLSDEEKNQARDVLE